MQRDAPLAIIRGIILVGAMMVESLGVKYRAFISYSHADTPSAKWLHRALESFHIDKDLVGRETANGPIPKTLRPIFRDRDDFTAGHSLSEQTLAALDASAALVVICSPASAKSHYVNEETRLFKSRHKERPVVPLIVAGEVGDSDPESLPPSLRFELDAEGQITNEPADVLAADAREAGDGRSLALAKVVAGLLGISSDDVFRRAERERRRRGRVRNGIIAVLALLAVASTGSAVYAWEQLQTNEALLDATLKRSTEFITKVVAQAETYRVPRKTTLELLASAEGMFDDMARLGRPTPELRYRKAMMLLEFGRNYAMLGDTTKRRERVDEAHRLLVTLAAEKPDDVNYQSGLWWAQGARGDALAAEGNLTEALKSYEDSLAIADHLARADPNKAPWQVLGSAWQVAASYERIAAILEAQGNLVEALKFYRADFGIIDFLAKANPGDTARQHDLSLGYGRVGDVLLAQGGLVEALKSYQDGFAIADQLAKANPDNAEWQSNLWVSYNRIGDVLDAQGTLAEALKSYQDGLAIADRLANADPGTAEWQRHRSISYDRIGEVLQAQGNLVEALKFYRAGLTVVDGLAKADPSNPGRQRDLRAFYERVGDVLLTQGNLDEALKIYRADLAVSGRLAEADPTNVTWQHDLSLCYGRVGDVLLAQGNPAEALKSYQDYFAIADHLAEADPSNAEWQRDLSVSYERVGKVLQAQGDLAEALNSYQDGLAISDRLAKADPSNAQWQRDLVDSHFSVGTVFALQGEAESALAEYRQAREITAQLRKQSPHDTTLSDALARCDAEIAKLEQATAAEPRTAQPEQAVRQHRRMSLHGT